MVASADAAARMRAAEAAWSRYAAEAAEVHQVEAEKAWATRRDDTLPPDTQLAAAAGRKQRGAGASPKAAAPRASAVRTTARAALALLRAVVAPAWSSGVAAAPAECAAQPTFANSNGSPAMRDGAPASVDYKAAEAARAAEQAARGAAAVAALRQQQAAQQAQRSAREAVSAEAAAAVAAAARAAGARTLPAALAAFGCGVAPGESTDAAFRRAALRFHPDRQRAALEACGGDELARLRIECTAAEVFKLLSRLRESGA